jgi:hypothetical protein
MFPPLMYMHMQLLSPRGACSVCMCVAFAEAVSRGLLACCRCVARVNADQLDVETNIVRCLH